MVARPISPRRVNQVVKPISHEEAWWICWRCRAWWGPGANKPGHTATSLGSRAHPSPGTLHTQVLTTTTALGLLAAKYSTALHLMCHGQVARRSRGGGQVLGLWPRLYVDRWPVSATAF